MLICFLIFLYMVKIFYLVVTYINYTFIKFVLRSLKFLKYEYSLASSWMVYKRGVFLVENFEIKVKSYLFIQFSHLFRTKSIEICGKEEHCQPTFQ